ncbi:Crp/Fnr family transcriptional regulator [Sphingomonas oryzagri]
MGTILIERSRHDAAAPPAEALTPVKDPCVDCAVRRSSLCGRLRNDRLLTLHRMGKRRRLARGETIAWAGEESPLCANLLSGMLKLTASTQDGREQVVGLVYPSGFVGDPFAGHSEFTVTALDDAEICAFPRAGFEQMLEDNRDVERELLHRTFASLASARAQMLMLARQTASERVADFLRRTADEIGGVRAFPNGPLTFDLPLSRGAIADVLGLTIETVSRQMTGLKAAGVIGLPGGRGVTIIRRDELERMAGRV